MSLKPNSGVYTLNSIHAHVIGRHRTIVSDTAPSLTDVDEGTEWYNSSNGKKYIVFIDSDSKQWVSITPS